MATMTVDQFNTHLGLLAEATGKDLTQPLVALWLQKYGGVDREVLAGAFGRAIDTCRYFPSPAEFNEILSQGTGLTIAAPVGDPVRLKRSALAHGFFPANWDHDRYLEECRALGVAPRDGAVEFYATTGRPGAT